MLSRIGTVLNPSTIIVRAVTMLKLVSIIVDTTVLVIIIIIIITAVITDRILETITILEIEMVGSTAATVTPGITTKVGTTIQGASKHNTFLYRPALSMVNVIFFYLITCL